MRETGVSGRSWRAAVGAAVALIAAAVMWLAISGRPGPVLHAVAEQEVPMKSNATEPDHARAAAVSASVGADAPAPEDVHEPGEHPHPITAAHERIFRENNLVGALNLAVDLEDPTKIRELLAQYRSEYPEDEHRLQAGYALIAECLERLDAATRERAQLFWDTEIRSQTRRYVRRYCLERELAS